MMHKSRLGMFLLLAVVLPALWGCPATQVEYAGTKKSDDPATTAVLGVPDYIDVRTVDDQVIDRFYTRLLFNGERRVHIPAGPHAVVLRYNDLWNIDSNDHEKIRSYFIGVSFTAAAGGSYRVKINEPQDRAEAHKLAANFAAWIVDERTGKKVSE